VTVAELLANATRELAAGDARFYESVRDAWRTCRCAELATLVETLARAHGRPAIVEAKQKAWHTAWIARVREGNPLDLPGLLDGLVERAAPRVASMIASCLDELARYPDDPQLVLPLIQLLTVEAESSSWNKVHTRLFALLEAAGDPRAIELLEPAIARAQAPMPSDSMRDSLARAIRTRDRLHARCPGGLPATPVLDTRELLRTKPAQPIVPVVRVDELDALYQAVLEDPEDDGRRAVYADALQLRGDPRGEIIALQLANTTESNAKAARLIAKHRRTLLGGIAKTVIASTATFEKGFLVSCATDVRRAVEAEVVFGRPEWATVKRLTFGKYCALTSAMRSLEEAHAVSQTALAALRTITLPKLRMLHLTSVYGLNGERPTNDLAVLAETTGLPGLRELRLDARRCTPQSLAWLFAAPLGGQLTHLRVLSEGGAVAEWQRALGTWPHLHAIELYNRDAPFVITRPAAAR
jgi:uncharacterized protein (TIGR02996 family)